MRMAGPLGGAQDVGAGRRRAVTPVLVALLLSVAVSGCGLKGDVRLAQARAQASSQPSADPATATAAPSPSAASPSPSPSPSSTPPATSRAEPSPTAAPTPRTAAALVGRWHVDGPGVAPGTALVLGEELALFLPCGVLDGGWEADGPQGLFVALTFGGDSTCFSDGSDPAPSWLTGARRFAVDGDARTLLDAADRPLVRLRPGARPTVGPNRSSSAAAEPQLTPRLRARLADPAPLPADARPVTPEQLQRRWVPVEVEEAAVELRFGSDGRYTGSDGCNGAGGRYVLGRHGRLLAAGGPSTSMGCRGAPVGYWVDAAARAGLVDGDLVLYDADAQVLGRLRAG
jgi:predicted small lipoprotein YifL